MVHCLNFAFLFLFALLSVVLSAPVPDLQPRALSKRGYSGRATYFYVGLGNCGDTNVDADIVVALATSTYNNGAHCNQQVKITDSKGTVQYATVKDSCSTCAEGDLDMSPSLFQLFNSLDTGVFPMSWEFVDSSSNKDCN
ncbi:non-catalytic module family expn protein [Moniliophthora roreri MCA 2997]|uniref:Non-catalytic module family expn protein n=1 Tax=Moniliophthora roreri (strain MCA 2997) TaxID=1381753 RepID=V2XHC4_MONRO|nr:non-catalytic module family expn protein [Moniliophthora roreri MCA 2997]